MLIPRAYIEMIRPSKPGNRLIAKEKDATIAITAIMRKLVILANALLYKDHFWMPKAA
ncbi:hypothetical protein [Komagataeibacter europaeus]|uniref:hypothetical protein n=1 Tax=Komagataeibacter europaeus TaxID=33995 RepID=UPI000B57B791|nr:hypothetical protein [Komagataeibacter europaeus]ARW18314.1 hypothetical protein S101446_03240 [Komagataeibacter europaeus]